MHEFSEIEGILSQRFISSEEERQEIDRRIWEQFGEEKTILISDTSGFSRITSTYGIIHFLSMIVKLREMAIPIIEANQGEMVKAEADNLIAIFPHPDNAIKASKLIHERCRKCNAESPQDLDIISCHGISSGRVLVFKNDIYGHAVNIASKLGEDLAGQFQTLVSDKAAVISTQPCQEEFEECEEVISGITLKYYKKQY
jgi:class 3 adenylate cyclase